MSRLTRRMFLARGIQLPAAMLIVQSAAGACVDPDELSDSVQSMRDSLEYTDVASDARRACAGCAYFQAEKANAPCGHCEVLHGPVSAKGHCVSWTKKT